MQKTASSESRIHKFILCCRTSAPQLDVAAMERLGVKVKHVEYATTGDGIAMLAHLAEKLRRSDIIMKLFGEGAPYNSECVPSQQVQGRVEVLVESGETKAEYQRVLAARFATTEGKKKTHTSDEEQLCKFLDKRFSDLAVQIQSSTGELFALRKENAELKQVPPTTTEDSRIKGLESRIKELENENAAWLKKKDSFDRLTLDYSAWRFDLRGKDAEIASLQSRIVELEHALAQMTDRRNVLAARSEAQEKELGALRPLRFGLMP